MTPADLKREWLVISLELVLMPLAVAGVLYFWGRVDVAFVAISTVFTVGVGLIRAQDTFRQRPSKIIVDDAGLTRELYWTGHREYVPFAKSHTRETPRRTWNDAFIFQH